MNTNKIFLTFMIFTTILSSSCRKEIPTSTNNFQQENAINELNKIIRNDGVIFIPETKPSDSLHVLSIEEFVIVFNSIKKQKIQLAQQKTDTENCIKIFSDFDNDEIPRKIQPPGNHTIIYSPASLAYYYGAFVPNPSMFTPMYFNYTTNINGYVIGTPTINFSNRYSLFQWVQTSVSQFNINQQLGVTSFTLQGSAYFYVNSASAFIGWRTDITYKITIYTNGTILIDVDTDSFK